MKLWILATFLSVSVLIFSGCEGITPTPGEKVVVDSTLQNVELTENGVYVDMKAVGFEWKSIQDARVKGIRIYKQTLGEEGSEYSKLDTIENRFVTHYVDEDVEPAGKYGYYFKTFTEKSESNPSQEHVVQTLPPLDSVSWIHAVTNMPRSAKVIWRPHTNQIVEKYILERKTLEEDKWSELEVITGRLHAEYIDTDLKDDFVYKYRVRVLTYNDIVSKPSEEVKVVTKPLPKQVENIVATKDLPKQIKVTWAPATIKDFAHYNIYRAEEIDGSYELIQKIKTIEFVDNFKEDGKDYFYRISTVDTDGLESISDKKTAHGKTLIRPTTPSLVEAHMVGDNLELTWSSKDPRVQSFIVTKNSKVGWFNGQSEEFTDIKGTTFVDKSVAPESTYTYVVYSVDEFGIKSDPSIEVKYTTTKNQGKQPVPEAEQAPKAQEPAQPTQDNANVIKPMDDVDVSSL
jgi:uncharacterized protein